ncbi:type I-E CRISPR-associated protein Cas5/CasD [Streptomyces sp. NPDC050085]|uniref:type I-E CRISPR-associated protein Cas5/CasD n=1 Tax=Streptomyces sp. NPDC050085 TaxID=3365600 RepID=UPI0037A9911B
MTASSGLEGEGLLLHLAGPLQSWGVASPFNERDTALSPTRSGFIGLFAAALGLAREEPLGELRTLHFTVRIDRAGTRLRDFHTVGGGMPRHLTVATSEGRRRKGDTATHVSNRYYLQDAAFTVAVTCEDTDLLRKCANALRRPRWPLYLGRRSCPPTGPVLLAEARRGPLTHLLRLPLARTPSRQKRTSDLPLLETVEFTTDLPTDALVHAMREEFPGLAVPHALEEEVRDVPEGFASLDRRYGTRTQRRVPVQLPLPASQFGGHGVGYLHALTTYLDQERETLR